MWVVRAVKNPFKSLGAALTALSGKGRSGTSLRFRFLAFLLPLIIIIILGFLLLLIIFGVFSAESKEKEQFIHSNLDNFYKETSRDFDKLSLQGIALSEQLSENITLILRENSLNSEEYKNHPELLEKILTGQVEGMKSALKAAKSSGVYIILDSTVNDKAQNAKYSRAGIFLKSTEPNIINSVETNARYLCGPAKIARSCGIQMLPQWEQEFDLKNFSFFADLVEDAKNSPLPLSRLYYWTDKVKIGGVGEDSMLLAVPILSDDGTVYGICGFEVSSMLFKLAYSPDNSVYPRIFAAIFHCDDDVININDGLIAGNYYMINSITRESMTITDDNHFYTYSNGEGVKLSGFHKRINLYPEGAVCKDSDWAVGIMIPEEEFSIKTSEKNNYLVIGIIVLLIISLSIVLIISKRFLSPINKAFDNIKTENWTKHDKTKILEIDSLFEFLTEKNDKREMLLQTEQAASESVKDSAAHSTAVFERFIKNIPKLSAAERTVFNLYLEGHTAKEIAEILFLSINTIKTHNRRIFEKLEVSSRKELMIYIQMMKEVEEKEKIKLC